jgi:hypothetical protein
MGPVQTWANITMCTLGISGALIENSMLKWLCFAMGTALGALIFFISYFIFRKAIDSFSEIGHPKADEVVKCLWFVSRQKLQWFALNLSLHLAASRCADIARGDAIQVPASLLLLVVERVSDFVDHFCTGGVHRQ